MTVPGAEHPELVIVPHTHWDREWYLPFQRVRLRLVAVLDRLLTQLADDPRTRFTLDGQTAAVDDYLAIRPEKDGLVRELVGLGRLAVGPWRVLADSFLCSGENLLRNLELGLRRADDLGGAMRVGYLPDQFGHCAQLPQILRVAGIRAACVWRGVPEAVDGTWFRWVAPDGTAVRTRYLPEGGYGGAAGVFAEGGPALVRRRAAEHIRALRRWQPDGPLLGMYGTDHSAPVDDLADLVEAASRPAAWEETVHPDGEENGETRMRLDTLAGFFKGLVTDTAEGFGDAASTVTVHGELRSHARADILPGVLSSRIPLKQALSRAERLVERYAEPLVALYGHPYASQPFLNLAWERLVDASCHDSVTGCGADATADQVAARIAEADDLGRGVVDLVLAPIAATVPDGGHLLFNPSPRRRTEVVTLDLPADRTLVTASGEAVPCQVLATEQTTFADEMVPADDLDRHLRKVHGRELHGSQITAWDVDADARTIAFDLAATSDLGFDVADVRAAAAATGVELWRVKVRTRPRHTVAARVEVEPLALAAVTAAPAAGLPSEPALGPVPPSIAAGRGSLSDLDNGLMHIALRSDGLLDVLAADGTHAAGLGAIVDGGDLGDEYTYAPPARDRVVDSPDEVWNRVLWSGPLTGALESTRWYRWPKHGEPDQGTRAATTVTTEIGTRVELRQGEPFVRLTISFDNQADDHRVRLHLPLPRAAACSHAEGQFAVVDRALHAEGGSGEHPVPTFPAYGWVAAGGLAVLLDHVSEYELVDGGRTLALTLLRSVGLLSRTENAWRRAPAGPQLATPGAQCHGLRTVELGLFLYAGAWHESRLLEAAERFRHPFTTAPGQGQDPDGTPDVPEGGIEIGGRGVVLSSCRDVGRDGPELRLVALTPEPTTATVHSTHGHGDIAMRPWQIMSVAARSASEKG
ncbi:alpha-mannosidase [Catenulispora subtropica]|uniref:Glycoside hydrolase family 38 N-terminal domain-containing protein n=1 Tax=Catenulispora subtropica TaxID=450798 RepID=A0ABP5BYQ9_9ACTN